jgi:hypothetical protein
MIFTQFLFPNGRQKQISIQVSEDLENKVKEIENAGYRFELEVFPEHNMLFGMINMDCCNADEVLSGDLCKNDETLQSSIQNLIEDAYKEWKNK